MGWPQWTWIGLMAVAWLLIVKDHGKPREGKQDVRVATAVVAVHSLLLWQGGFFG